jgi:hypothetical protein
MEWYYAAGSRQLGPVSDATLGQLARDGVVNDDTLVWREGMTDWQPWSVARSGTTPPAPTATPPARLAVCSQCGRSVPAENTVLLGRDVVCGACKQVYLQKLQEGVPTTTRRENLEQVLAIAKAQKGVIWCILASLACYAFVFASMATQLPAAMIFAMVMVFGALAFQIVFVYRLAAALEAGPPLLWVLGILLCSWIGLILMLILSSRATAAIRKAGFRVGLMGADLNEIQAALR